MKCNRRVFFKAGAGLFLSQMMWGTRDLWGQTASHNYFALHIGLNDVDYAAYQFSGIALGPLYGCINDANDYSEIVRGEKGFKRIILTDKEPGDRKATVKNVYGHIVWAADKLKPGDLFVVTYAGHGSYVPDTSNPRDEDDNPPRDETLCLWDRMLLDDELALMWGQFRPGVRIVFISDSCNSGSVARAAQAAARFAEAAGNQRNRSEFRALFGNGSFDASVSTASRFADPANGHRAIRNRGRGVIAGEVPLFRSPSPVEAEAAYRAQKQTYDQINAEVRIGDQRARAAIRATGLLLAACQDWEFAKEVQVGSSSHGMFTRAFRQAAANASDYTSLYTQAQQAVLQLSGGVQEPNFFPFGNDDPRFYDQEPFSKDPLV